MEPSESAASSSSAAAVTAETLPIKQEKLLAAIKAIEKGEKLNMEELLMGKAPKSAGADKKHDFWSTQPVPQAGLLFFMQYLRFSK